LIQKIHLLFAGIGSPDERIRNDGSLSFGDIGYIVKNVLPSRTVKKETMFRSQQKFAKSAPAFLFSGGGMGGSLPARKADCDLMFFLPVSP
jgi:hypothetical protein